MRRREFFTLIGGAAAWPLAARAQAMPVIGFLGAGLAAEWARLIAAFRQGLEQVGFVDGQNVHIEYRWAENQYDRLPSLAADLVHRQPAVIFAANSTPAAVAAKAATATIPIVFTMGADPVKYALVASLNRPASNATGVIFLTSELAAKQFEFIHELLPNAPVIGVLVNPDNTYAQTDTGKVQEASLALSRKVFILNVNNDADLDAAFLAFVEQRVGVLQIPGDAFFYTRRDRIVALASRHALPTIYAQREFVDIGGLMSYGASLSAANRIAGGYVGRIIKGEKPADLPVQQSTKVELIVNLKTAKALGLDVPPTLIARADEVIE
jgi:putative ABC transport system substrate-binding protein